MTRPRQTLVLVTGASSGLGKSTLARSLSEALAHEGVRVSLFREEDIRREPAFAEVMSVFEATGEVDTRTLLVAAGEYLRAARRQPVDVFVLDALFPYLPSLLAWGHTDAEVAAFFSEIATRFDGFGVIELHLAGDVAAGLQRAAGREGGDWLDDHVARMAARSGAPPIDSVDGAAAYLGALAARSRRLLEAAPWPVEVLDADAPADEILAAALTASSAVSGSRSPR